MSMGYLHNQSTKMAPEKKKGQGSVYRGDEDTSGVMLIEILGSQYGHGEVPMGWNVLED